jgi:hypothetical protein
MASTAEGQHDGIQPSAGPTSKFDGVSAHPEIDGKTELKVDAGRIEYPWKTGNESTTPSSGFALGADRPD